MTRLSFLLFFSDFDRPPPLVYKLFHFCLFVLLTRMCHLLWLRHLQYYQGLYSNLIFLFLKRLKFFILLFAWTTSSPLILFFIVVWQMYATSYHTEIYMYTDVYEGFALLLTYLSPYNLLFSRWTCLYHTIWYLVLYDSIPI